MPRTTYFRSDRTLGQLCLGNVGDPLEVIVTGVAEVRRAEAEEDGDRAAIPALVLQVVSPVLGTHLSLNRVNIKSYFIKLHVECVYPSINPSI